MATRRHFRMAQLGCVLAALNVANGCCVPGAVFGLWGLAFIGGFVEQIGALVRNPSVVNIGIISSLILPTEAVFRRAAYLMTSPVVQSLARANSMEVSASKLRGWTSAALPAHSAPGAARRATRAAAAARRAMVLPEPARQLLLASPPSIPHHAK